MYVTVLQCTKYFINHMKRYHHLKMFSQMKSKLITCQVKYLASLGTKVVKGQQEHVPWENLSKNKGV